MIFTTYHPATRKAASYNNGQPIPTDLDTVAELVAHYLRFHALSGREVEFGDGATRFGNRTRIVCRQADESKQRLFDICIDGKIVNPKEYEVDPETGLPR